MKKNIPNYISILRVFLAPIFLYLFIKTYYLAAFISFFVASVTDALDGFIARKYKLVTKFGMIVDPLADKVLVLFAFLCILNFESKFIEQSNTSFLVNTLIFLLIFRDIVITIFRLQLKKRGKILKSIKLGKIKTSMQFIFIHLFLIDYLFLELFPNGINIQKFGIINLDDLFYLFLGFLFLLTLFLATLFSLISGFQYLYNYEKKST